MTSSAPADRNRFLTLMRCIAPKARTTCLTSKKYKSDKKLSLHLIAHTFAPKLAIEKILSTKNCALKKQK
jgi:hypothetical protein